jgi:hypothetical protein
MKIRDCEILPYNEIFLLPSYALLEQVITSELFGAKTTYFFAVNRETNYKLYQQYKYIYIYIYILLLVPFSATLV